MDNTDTQLTVEELESLKMAVSDRIDRYWIEGDCLLYNKLCEIQDNIKSDEEG